MFFTVWAVPDTISPYMSQVIEAISLVKYEVTNPIGSHWWHPTDTQRTKVFSSLIGSAENMIPITKPTENSLLERLGGVGTMRRVIDEFYDNMVGDRKLQPLLEGSKISALKVHQMRFFRIAFSGIPSEIDVIEMLKEKHQFLFENKGMDETHFDIVIGHLVTSLRKIQVADALVDECLSIVSPLRVAFEEGAINARQVLKPRPVGLTSKGSVRSKPRPASNVAA